MSGPKASADSLTPSRSSLAELNAVDFQFELLSSVVALGLVLSLGCGSFGTLSEEAAVSVIRMNGQREKKGQNSGLYHPDRRRAGAKQRMKGDLVQRCRVLQ